MHAVTIIGDRSSRPPNQRWSAGAAPNMPGCHAPQKGHFSSPTPMSFPQLGQIIDPGDMAAENTGAPQAARMPSAQRGVREEDDRAGPITIDVADRRGHERDAAEDPDAEGRVG